AGNEEWERSIAEYGKVVTVQPADGALLMKLATAYQSAGRTREAVRYLAKIHAADPQNSVLVLKLTSLAPDPQNSVLVSTCLPLAGNIRVGNRLEPTGTVLSLVFQGSAHHSGEIVLASHHVRNRRKLTETVPRGGQMVGKGFACMCV